MLVKAPLRVTILNDYELVVAGFEGMLAAYSDRVDVVRTAAGRPLTQRVDIALYDSFGQNPCDRDSIALILKSPLVKRSVVYTWNFHPALIDRATQDGASGYLSKALTAGELVDALEQVHAGHVVLSPSPKSGKAPRGNWPGREAGLSFREGEVIALITQGLSNDEIASGMYLSLNSVKSYIRSAYRKIGVTRRSQAVSWGLRHALAAEYVRLVINPASVQLPTGSANDAQDPELRIAGSRSAERPGSREMVLGTSR